MSYISAEEVLPQELIEAIQQYVSGRNIYIPCKEKMVWGSRTETRQYYAGRDREICLKHRNGIPVKRLADEYALSVKSIQRILRSAKQQERPAS
ncbi:MAG: hypothetical protein E7288_09825 [Lachnospiraceae bacterium]|nr:hypothetical protein [Lachnospiraceae bacterium]